MRTESRWTWMRLLLLSAAAGGLLALPGCHSGGVPRPPGPLPAVNAALPNDVPVYVDCPANNDPNADTRVVARCRGSANFWKTTRGDWEYTWAVVGCDVLTVERGTWPDATLSFLAWDSWPTLESGILVNKQPWPYFKDVVLAFDLDTTPHPAHVLGQVVRHNPRSDPGYYERRIQHTQPTTPTPAAPQ
jgi:hypothetical protein